MKASRYNYFVDNGDKTIVFNGITASRYLLLYVLTV